MVNIVCDGVTDAPIAGIQELDNKFTSLEAMLVWNYDPLSYRVTKGEVESVCFYVSYEISCVDELFLFQLTFVDNSKRTRFVDVQKRWEMISRMGINVGDHMKKQHDEHWYLLLWEPGENESDEYWRTSD